MGMGDQAFYHQALELIRTLQHQGKTMILASHSLELITMLCQKALWLEKGRVVQFGDAPSVVAAYQAGAAHV
jgi:ABC-type polysaccharide/polyol phosphate transport system ATPase subunit